MASTAHTTGPWILDGGSICAPEEYSQARIAQVYASEYGSDVSGKYLPKEANARLIAAAPELLDTLKALIGWADCVLAEPERFGGVEAARNLRGPAFDDARAAISKAEAL